MAKLLDGLGVITFPGDGGSQAIYAFVTGQDGHLYVNWDVGRGWAWEDQGTPVNTTVVGAPGVITFPGAGGSQAIYAFAMGGDGHLYVNWNVGRGWAWEDQGTPPRVVVAQNKAPGVITFPGDGGSQAIYAFVAGQDGHLYVNWDVGRGWAWEDQGISLETFVNSSPGVITYQEAGSQRIYAFVAGQDGHLYVNWWNGQQWVWEDQGTPPALQDISPDPTNVDQETLNNLASDSTSGRILGVVGNANLLYAFSEKAGVWKSVSGGPWIQLPGSPRPAQQQGPNIAVDPQNASHVVAGNDSGAWESTDAGASWFPIYQPAAVGCGSNQISAVAFDANSQLFLGVDCGIALRQSPSQQFTLTRLPPVFGQNIGPVTALAVSQTKIWARTSNALLVSTTNGMTWSAPSIVPNTIQFRPQEVFTLAAFDDFAFMVAGVPDPVSPGSTDNTLIIYDSRNGAWEVQNVTLVTPQGDIQKTADGTGGSGVDGRKFVKSYILNTPNVPMVVGQGLQLFYGAGQQIFQAAGLDTRNGTVTSWNWIVDTLAGSGRDPVHADMWDFLIDVSVGGNTAWIAGDGGIFRFVTTFPFNFPQGGWKTQLLGLHTHQIHTITVLNTSPDSRSRLAYPTSDNDAWIRDTAPIVMPDPLWQSRSVTGDANYTVGDPSCPDFVMLVRHRQQGMFVKYGVTSQGAALLNYKYASPTDFANSHPIKTIGPDGPTTFQFIPSPQSAGRFSTVDAVMLVDLPLTFWDNQSGVNVPFFPPTHPLGQNSNGAPVLLRNTNFDANPDINTSKGNGWTVALTSFPAGTLGFYVTGNRTKPIYYSYTQNTLSRLDRSPIFGIKWTPVATNLVSTAQFGPAFINSWDPNILYVLTTNGIQVSTNGGVNFNPDGPLTSLVAGTGNLSMSTVSQIAFNYDNPSERVCGAQTGVFYSPGNGRWIDLTALLPSPLTPVTAVGIDNEGVYVATDGHSLLLIRGANIVIP